MIDIKSKEMCSGCMACFNVCPKQCIQFVSDEEGFQYPRVDVKKCINCNLCEKVCPFINAKINSLAENNAFAAKNNNDLIRRDSSSGGVFYEIAKHVLDEGGVVYGSKFDEDFKKIVHSRIDKVSDLEPLLKSKYLQSSIGDTFKECKRDLKSGKKVFFVGTPCQINGLIKFLDIEYDNLITGDLICHGVPSPQMWCRYKNYIEKKYNARITDVNFRKKLTGEKLKTLKDKTKMIFFEKMEDNIYFNYFLSDIALRNSCYSCKCKNTNVADITFGDFWGISNILPEFADTLGCSLVIIRNNKILNLLEKKNIDLFHVDFQEAIKFNPSYFVCPRKPLLRDRFFKYDYFSNKYVLKYKLKRKYIRAKITSKNFIKYVLLRRKKLNYDKDLKYGIQIILEKTFINY